MDDETSKLIKERFKLLPRVVQDAITSADVEKRLRALADTHKLHVDQWETLGNEVMLALLGFLPMEELASNIKSEVGVSEDTAQNLARDISKVVFEPIREQLERELEHPEAKAENLSGIESARAEILEQTSVENAGEPAIVPPAVETPIAPPVPSVVPATPPPPPPTVKAERGPASGAYKPGEASIARKSVDDDPYRESPA